ncbi:MAG: disulfide bond formation protein B [Chlamydiales bacterium]|nr:disulfide bond formation protein B [Chlamydiales bacterium]
MNKYYQNALGIFLGIAIVALIISFFVEYVIGIRPCILCKLQRVPYIATGLSALIGFFTPLKRMILRFIQVCFLAGVILAAYHSCIQFGFLGSPCQKKQIQRTGPSWRILGLPPPLYNGVFSLAVLIGTEIFLVRTRKKV